MKLNIPVELPGLLENWLSDCFACVKWHCSWSFAFKVSSGVRQGSVLSPYLLAVFYVDDVGKLFNVHFGTYIVLYADDILLLAPSVAVLQMLLDACEEELNSIDIVINIKKSICMRIGSRNDKMCAKMCDGGELPWVDEICYLGVLYPRCKIQVFHRQS